MYDTSATCSDIHFTGTSINVTSGKWMGNLSGVGAGIDSFFEYLLKVRKSIYNSW